MGWHSNLDSWDLNVGGDCRLLQGPGNVIFLLLWWMDSDHIRNRFGGSLLALRIPIKHDFHLDTKNTLQQLYRFNQKMQNQACFKYLAPQTTWTGWNTKFIDMLTCLKSTCLTAESIYSLTGWPDDIMYPSLNFIDLARWALSLPLTITWRYLKVNKLHQ